MNANGRIAACFLLAYASLALAAPARLETLDGQATTGELVSIDPGTHNVALRAGQESVTVPVADVSDLTWGAVPDVMGKPGQLVLLTHDGGRLAAKGLTLATGDFCVRSALGDAIKASINSVADIYFPHPQLTPAQVQAKVRELVTDSSQDILVVSKKDGSWVTVEGSLKAITEKDVTFRWKDADRVTDRAGVVAVRLAALKAERPAVAGELLGTDGSNIRFSRVEGNGEKLLIHCADLGEMTVPMKAVAAIRFFSDRVVPLAELKPAQVKEHGFLDEKFPYRLNRSAGGKRITLGGVAYDSGVGMHSFCELTYALDGHYKTFVALAGIDDAVRPAGDATLTILGDGKPLADLRLSGKDKPQAVKVDLQKVKTLVIRADFGPDKLAAGDQVDLAGARLIK